jgi:uncharacterized protein (DUF1501 family)
MKRDAVNEERRIHSGLTRRSLLGSSSALAATTLLAPRVQATSRRPGNPRPVLVQVFLRGAMDGLTTVVPYADGDLYTWRPTLAVQPPGPPTGAVNLDGFFGLAPAAAPLLTPYSNGHLAIVHASGSIDPTRSHFEAFARMEFGDPALPPNTVDEGWITRYLVETQAQATSPLRAIGVNYVLPFTLAGAANALPIADLDDFSFPGVAATAPARVGHVVGTYGPRPAPVGPSALATIDSIGILAGIDFAGYVPSGGAQYPGSRLGLQLRQVAALIKAQTGVEVVALDVEGWDLHAELGPLNGAMAGLLDDLTRSFEAFYLDLQGNLGDYVLVCLSEFGRRVEENSSSGTDHGHGNAMLVMGGGIDGGQVVADWPGLGAADLDQGDLAITTDYRDVLGEILQVRLGVANLGAVFPQHTFDFPGVTL